MRTTNPQCLSGRLELGEDNRSRFGRLTAIVRRGRPHEVPLLNGQDRQLGQERIAETTNRRILAELESRDKDRCIQYPP